MATVLRPIQDVVRHHDALTGTDRAEGLDRWIFVLTAAIYIVIVLVGFIPDSLVKIEMVKAGLRAPFPPIMHVHAVVMGAFLLILLAQTWLAATGRIGQHMRLGVLGALLGYGLIVVGFILAPTMYHQVWNGLQHAPPEAQGPLRELNLLMDNILLLQLRGGTLFALFFTIGLVARARDSGLHKRMLILAPVSALSAATDRMHWLPTMLPGDPIMSNIYPLLAVAPLFWLDVSRNRSVHRAWWIFIVGWVVTATILQMAWNQPWWHAAVHRIMGV